MEHRDTKRCCMKRAWANVAGPLAAYRTAGDDKVASYTAVAIITVGTITSEVAPFMVLHCVLICAPWCVYLDWGCVSCRTTT
jgi:hypothetical protein